MCAMHAQDAEVVQRDGQPALLLRDLPLAPGLVATRLELVYPQGTSGDAESLRARTGSLSHLELLVRPPAELPGLPGVDVCAETEGPVVRWSMPDGAVVSCRPEVYARDDGRPMLALCEVRIHGTSEVPVPLAANGLLGRLASSIPGITPLGPLHAALDLPEPLAEAVSRADLLRPDAAGLRLGAALPIADGLRLRLAQDPDAELPRLPDSFARFAQVDRALAAGRVSEVSQVCATALQQGQDRVASMTRIAWCISAQPDAFQESEAILDRFLTLEPGLPAALLAQAAILAAQGAPEDAAARMETLAAGDACRAAERACALLAAGRLLAAAGAVDRAGDLLAEALRADATLVAGLAALAALPDTVSPRGGPNPVDATARLALAETDPRRAALLHRAVGLRLLAKGDPEPARRHLERTLALDPADREAEDGLAVCLLRAGHAPRARAVLDAAGRAGDLERLVERAVKLSGGSVSEQLPAIGELPPMGQPEDSDEPEEPQEPADDDSESAEAPAPAEPEDEPEEPLPAADPPEADEPPAAHVEVEIVAESETVEDGDVFADEPEDDDDEVSPATALEAALSFAGRTDPGARRQLEALTADATSRRTLIQALADRTDLASRLLSAELHVANDDPFAAEGALCAALEQEPNLPAALDFLARLYRSRENWQGYVDVRTRHAGLAADRDRWADALLDVAAVRHEQMGQRKQALATTNAVLKVLAERADAHVLRAELLEAESRPADALAVLRHALGLQQLPARLRIGVLERRARLAARAGEPPAAVAGYWGELLEQVPGHPAALEALQLHHERRGETAQELALVEQRLAGLEGELEAARARRVRSTLRGRRASLVLALRGARDEAKGELREAVEDWDENVEAWELLADLHREDGETGSLLDVLERLESLMVPGPARNALAAERAALLSR